MLMPYKVDVPMARWPIANWVILAAMLLVFLTVDIVKVPSSFSLEELALLARSKPKFSPWVLDGWSLQGLVGHMWLHAGVIHLLGNGLFLWVFGNAICAKVGNVLFPAIYVGLGLVAGLTHLVLDGGPVVGASGAINGVIGMYLVLYPLNSVSCAFWFVYIGKTFNISGLWLILLWLAYDIWGATAGGGSVAYFAHLGGFAAGAGLAVLMLKMQWLQVEPYEESLLQVINRKWGRTPPERFVDTPAPRPVPAAVAPALGTSGAPILVRCGCGQALQAARKHLGKTVKCPACEQPVLIAERRRKGMG